MKNFLISPFAGQEAEVEGTLSVQPQANEVKGFKEYFLNLTVENNKRNPWFGGELVLNARIHTTTSYEPLYPFGNERGLIGVCSTYVLGNK